MSILDHPTLIRELKLLERRPRAGGRTQVDHPSGGHDDHANSLALAAALAIARNKMPELHIITFRDEEPSYSQEAQSAEESAKAEEEAQDLEERQRAALWGPSNHCCTLGS